MTTEISSGAVSSGAILGPIGSGQSLLVEAGGTAVAIDILGGTEQISGLDSGAVVTSDGFQFIYAGGLATGTTVDSGATEEVKPFGTALGTVVGAGGSALVSAGGMASAITVGQGGFLDVSYGGQVSGGVVSGGGYAGLSGSATGLTVGSGGWLTISAGGVLTDAVVDSGGIVFALSGGAAADVTLDAGASLIETPGASALVNGPGTVIDSGVAIVSSGTAVTAVPALGGVVLSGAVAAFVLPGGDASGGTLLSGAALHVYSGGSINDETLIGSYAVISSGGLAVSSVITQGSVEYVFSRGSASATVVGSGFDIVDAGGSATRVTVGSGGNLVVDGWSTGSGTDVISTAGSVVNATIEDGGNLYVDFGGSASDVTLNTGAAAYVFGAIDSATLDSGSDAILESAVSTTKGVHPGGVLRDADIRGAVVVVHSAAEMVSDTVRSGGIALVEAGGTSLDTKVMSGGTLILLSGAVDESPDVQSGATIIASGVVVLASPAEVSAGSSLSAPLVLLSGMSALVLAGGVVSGATIENHGSLQVQSGGAIQDIAIAAGGDLLVQSGAVLTGAITFSGIEGQLEFDTLATSGAVVTDFTSGETILFDLISGPSATARLVSGNELEVTGYLSGGSQTLVSAVVPLASPGGYSGGFATTTTDTGGTAVTLATTAVSSSSVLPATGETAEIPLTVLNYGGGYKIGIEISLDGGATYKLYEFDTGGTGFVAAYNAAWWSPYSVVSTVPALSTYTSGNTYISQVVSTTVTFPTETGGTISTVGDVALVNSAQDPGGFSAQNWNANLTDIPSTAPLEQYFYGDFGVGLGASDDGVNSILSQLGGGLGNGFIVTVGTNPGAASGQVGNLQVGLTQADLQGYATIVAMQGQNALDTFANSGESTYTEMLAEGMLIVGGALSGALTFSPTGFVFDTGEQTTEIHTGSVISGGSLGHLASNGGAILGADGDTSFVLASTTSGWTLDVAPKDLSLASESATGNTTGYVNTGLDAFWGVSVMFDLADGVIGFKLMCFAGGTVIGTPDGGVAIEDLRIGDHVETVAGGPRRIIWIGHRVVDCGRHPSPQSVWPVRIQAHAFGPNLPWRDLDLSPDHALYLEGVLVPVKYLVNGHSVAYRPAARVTYYHIELEHHDVILAEGLPCETYLDAGYRAAFANGGSVVQAHPAFAPPPEDAALVWDALGYAPLVVAGPVVERAKLRLAALYQRPLILTCFAGAILATQPGEDGAVDRTSTSRLRRR